MERIETSARLALIEQAGLAVATLVEGLSQDELLRSRLTRAEVQRQLRTLVASAAGVTPGAREAMPEVDWNGWAALGQQLAQPAGEALDEALWFACSALVPATLLWLRVYRQGQPALFRMGPG